MTLGTGARLGPYEILSPLGAGGMGEVWRARDGKLGRDVAIKVLTAQFAQDAERLSRLGREARVLASLNHPNIAAIYGLEEADGEKFLVLECVEGETLADKLAPAPLSVEETLRIGVQIAQGLEAAHEAGVVHRDLKPGNIKVRPDGSIKILDFGLAKVGVARSGGVPTASDSLTETVATREGVILGTAAYMSPEQARGAAVDRRSDIFSFGSVLYECLTGQRAFAGATVSDTLAAILKAEPDWSLLPGDAPSRVGDILRRCLRKDPKRRLHDIADARIELEETLAEPQAPEPEHRRPSSRWRLAAAVGGLVVAVLSFVAGAATRKFWRAGTARAESPAERISVRATLPLSRDTEMFLTPYQDGGLAVSPDGRRMVFSGTRGGNRQLFARRLDGAEVVPISGTEGGFNPFFSPDGEWLGFFTISEMRKVPLSGGTSAKICEVPPVSHGGSWAPDGRIYFSPAYTEGLYRVPAQGGLAETFARPDHKAGEHGLYWPQILPGGREILFVVRSGRDFQDVAHSKVVVQSLETGERRELVDGVSPALWLPPGWLLFMRGTALFLARCPAGSWKVEGTPVRVAGDLLTAPAEGAASFAASMEGTIVFALGGEILPPRFTLVWADRSGREDPLPIPASGYTEPRLSPDGSRLALGVEEGPRQSVWVYDFRRNLATPLVTEPGRSFCPAWSSDGKRLAFARITDGPPQLSWKPSDGSGPLEHLTKGEVPEFPGSFHPDGRAILYARVADPRAHDVDLHLLTLNGSRADSVFLATPFHENAGFFSPDGKWIAYVSDESGRDEVYVRPYPGPGAPVRVSTDGGSEPAWSADGKELFYRRQDAFLAAAVSDSQGGFATSTPRRLFAGDYLRGGGLEAMPREYEVSRDGKRLLLIKPVPVKREPILELQVLTDVFSLLENPSRAHP